MPQISFSIEEGQRLKYQDGEKLKVLKRYAQEELDRHQGACPYSHLYWCRSKKFLEFVLESEDFYDIPLQPFPKEAIEEIQRLPFMEDHSLPAAYETIEWLQIYYKKQMENNDDERRGGRRGGRKSAVAKKTKRELVHGKWQQFADCYCRWNRRCKSKRQVALYISQVTGENVDTIRRAIHL